MHTGVCKCVTDICVCVRKSWEAVGQYDAQPFTLGHITALRSHSPQINESLFTCRSSFAISADVSPPSPLPGIPGTDGDAQW